MVYSMQKNKLGHTVLTPKTIIQTDHPNLRYKPKRGGLVWRKPNRQILAYISSQLGPFDLSFFALKPCVLARSFAYYKPHVLMN